MSFKMTNITSLTVEQATDRTISLMKLSRAALVTKCELVSLDTTGSKADLVKRIIGNSASIQTDAKPFDYSGLMIRV